EGRLRRPPQDDAECVMRPRGAPHAIVTPPSATITWPVMKLAAGPARNAATATCACEERASCTGEDCGAPADLVRHADAAQRCLRIALRDVHLVLPQRARKIGSLEPRSDAVHASFLRPPCARQAARERKVARLRDAVGAEHSRAADAA